jgi:hypothetical protein
MAELGIAASTLIDFFVQRSFTIYELPRNGKLRMLPAGQVKVESDEWINLLCSREEL